MLNVNINWILLMGGQSLCEVMHFFHSTDNEVSRSHFSFLMHVYLHNYIEIRVLNKHI